MSKEEFKAWKVSVKSFSNAVVESKDLQTLYLNIINAYRTSEIILINCIKHQKVNRAAILRKHLNRYFNNCQIVKKNITDGEQQSTNEDLNAYNDVMAMFLSFYIDIIVLSTDLKPKEQRSMITTSLFSVLGFKEERVINALLGSSLSEEQYDSIFFTVYKRVMEEPIANITCSHYVKLALLANRGKSSSIENAAEHKSKMKKLFSRHQFPDGMEYFLRNKFGAAFPLELPVERKELKKFLRKLDDNSANILEKKLFKNKSKKLKKKPLAEVKQEEVPEKKPLRLFFFDVNRIINKTTDKEDGDEQEQEKEEENDEQETVKVIQKNLDNLIRKTKIKAKEPKKVGNKFCKVTLEEFAKEPLDDDVGKPNENGTSASYNLLENEEDEEDEYENDDEDEYENDEDDNESIHSSVHSEDTVSSLQKETEESEEEEDDDGSNEMVTEDEVNSEEEEEEENEVEVLENDRQDVTSNNDDEEGHTSEEDVEILEEAENESEKAENESEVAENESEVAENVSEEVENESEEVENESEEVENESEVAENVSEEVENESEVAENVSEEAESEAETAKNEAEDAISSEDDVTYEENEIRDVTLEAKHTPLPEDNENETEDIITLETTTEEEEVEIKIEKKMEDVEKSEDKSSRKGMSPKKQNPLETIELAEVSSSTDIANVLNTLETSSFCTPDTKGPSPAVELQDNEASSSSSSSDDLPLKKASEVLKKQNRSLIEPVVQMGSKVKVSPTKQQKITTPSERRATDSRSSSKNSSAQKRSRRFESRNNSLLTDISYVESPENVFVTPDSMKRRKLQQSKRNRQSSEKRRESLERKPGSLKKVSPKFTYSKSTRTSDVCHSTRSNSWTVTDCTVKETPSYKKELQPVVKLTKLLSEEYAMSKCNDSSQNYEKEGTSDVNTPAKRKKGADDVKVRETPKRSCKNPPPVTFETPRRSVRTVRSSLQPPKTPSTAQKCKNTYG